MSGFPSCAGLSYLRSWLDLMLGVAGYIFWAFVYCQLKWCSCCLCLIEWQGTPALSQAGIPTEALVKGPVSRLSTEESSPEKGREEAASKGHVIYEGKSGHILSYDSKYRLSTPRLVLPHVTGVWGWLLTCWLWESEFSFPKPRFPLCNVKRINVSTSLETGEKLTESVSEKCLRAWSPE